MPKRTPTIAETWARLAEYVHLLYRPVKVAEIRAAEKQLAIEFPPSYIELVTSVGAPAIAPRKGSSAKHVENLGFAVLRPPEIVKWTRELRAAPELDQADDEAQYEATVRRLANAVLFQLGNDAGEGYAWLTQHRAASGEMWVADYSHDYLYELAWDKLCDGVVFSTFAKATAHVAERIRQYAEEHGRFRR